ncbi:MAG: response regulator [Magnetococcales bacterium]|nr:response regulator [Magnetococcales bacterium]
MNNNRVLVMDDDEQLLEVYSDVLNPVQVAGSTLTAFAGIEKLRISHPSFEVTAAKQGEEGVEAVRVALSEEKPFAVAFVDIRMPPGIDGLEAARRIRELDDHIYIIIVTAYSDRSVDEIQDILEHDVIFARKPLTKDEILQLCRNACLSWAQDLELRTLRQNLEDRVEEQNRTTSFLESLVSSLTQGLIVATTSGLITSINPATVKLSGYSEFDLLGMSLSTLFPQDGLQNIIEKVLQQGSQTNRKATLKSKDGAFLEVYLSGSILGNSKRALPNKEEQSVVLVMQDGIT